MKLRNQIRRTLMLATLSAGMVLTGCVPQSNSKDASSLAARIAPRTADRNKMITYSNVKTVSVSDNLFGPMLSVIHEGGAINWVNTDKVTHEISSVPTDPTSFRLSVKPGSTVSLTFKKPGVYRYYGTKYATFSNTMNDARAKSDSGQNLVPMRGTVVVLSKTNTLPVNPHPSVIISRGTSSFTPWAMAVDAGATITWINHDNATHGVNLVPGFYTSNIRPLTLNAGESGQITFARPGVYYYYSPSDAKWDKSTAHLVPLQTPGSNRYVMDGLIWVNPTVSR